MTHLSTPTPPRQIAELDGLRAISVTFVMLVHASYGRLSGGFLGVDIFFVISGFLITHLLLHERAATGRVSLRDFYLRRIFRILPPLICAIALAMLLWPGSASDRMVVVQAALLFYANFLPAETLGNLGHTWSLAIEEQFYLVWPLLFATMFARARVGLIALALAVVVASVAVRYWLVAHWDNLEQLYTFTPARLDPIMLGCLLALCMPNVRQLLAGWSGRVTCALAWASAIAILGCLFFADRDYMQSTPFAFAGFALIAGVLVATAPLLSAQDFLRRALCHPWSRYIGRRSYGLYLYHYPIFGALEAWRTPGDVGNFVLVTGAKIMLSLAVTELSWRLVEAPALRVKARFSWAKTDAHAAAADRN